MGTQKNLFVHDVDHGHYSDTTDDTNTGRPNHRGDQIRAHNTAAPTCARGIATPSPLDVLSGRGGQTNHHVGNARFRAEARKLRSEYRDGGTSPGKKGLLHRDLVKKVQQYGGRFPEREARRKASQALREKRWD